jgi:hypothetical protein
MSSQAFKKFGADQGPTLRLEMLPVTALVIAVAGQFGRFLGRLTGLAAIFISLGNLATAGGMRTFFSSTHISVSSIVFLELDAGEVEVYQRRFSGLGREEALTVPISATKSRAIFRSPSSCVRDMGQK